MHNGIPNGDDLISEERHIDGPDCPLFVRVLGEGDPVTVFAHGLTGSLEETHPLATRVRGTRILFDLRGHGRSGHPPADAGYDHAAMRRDVEAVADMYGATRALGISMGAGALMQIVSERSDRFERVVLFLPASIDGVNATAEALFPMEADWLETMTVHEVADRIIADNETGDLFRRRPYWRALIRERVLRMNGVGMPRALRGFIEGPPPVADPDALRAVRAPVLLLAHEGDPLHDVAVARALAGLFPDVRLHVWDETLQMYDDLESFAGLIGDFLNGS